MTFCTCENNYFTTATICFFLSGTNGTDPGLLCLRRFSSLETKQKMKLSSQHKPLRNTVFLPKLLMELCYKESQKIIALFLTTKSSMLLWEEGPSLLKVTLKLANLKRFQMSLSLGAQLAFHVNRISCSRLWSFSANKDDKDPPLNC